MRKFLLSVAMLAACGMASAQKITFVPFGEGESANAYLEASAISANGRYIAGGTGEYAFITDMNTLETKAFISPKLVSGEDETATSDIRSISNDGVGYGYMEDCAAKFDFATGKYTKLHEDGGSTLYSTNAGDSLQLGVLYDDAFTRTPIIYVNGELQYLPEPKESTLGFEIQSGVAPTMSSENGDVIIGDVLDNYATSPMILWQKNADNKTYSLVPVCKRFFNPTFESWQKYDEFNGAAISANGKWVAMNIHENYDLYAGEQDKGQFIARYDVEADTLQIISCPSKNDVFYYFANGISNDGTIIGTIVNKQTQGTTGIICEAGSTEAKDLSEVFPTIEELNTMDGYENNTPCAITPDGRYIVGFGFMESPTDKNTLWYASWRLDTQKTTDGVDNVTAEGESSKVVASYNIDGTKVSNPKSSRFVINRLANGKSVKQIVK